MTPKMQELARICERKRKSLNILKHIYASTYNKTDTVTCTELLQLLNISNSTLYSYVRIYNMPSIYKAGLFSLPDIASWAKAILDDVNIARQISIDAIANVCCVTTEKIKEFCNQFKFPLVTTNTQDVCIDHCYVKYILSYFFCDNVLEYLNSKEHIAKELNISDEDAQKLIMSLKNVKLQ